ncbi:DUF3291 domain-containing protein [Bradyrhizobium sp.]|uniref:DUF3291 domain-containing protein n=1 Tax=Bradyrhizobium sp. TaxID=376 RepID=UPI0025C0C66E|nr:DUF3291 domain-containing protein [Bradyrhizobium sp.]MBV8919221.1 DUF3291 domain-containing protein [Bradyrhizobium sp.]
MTQPPKHHLAQLNVARAQDDLDSPRLADFMAALDSVNALAERSPGFVWHLQDPVGNATGIRASDDARFIVNMSVWESPAHLEQFVWTTIHKRVYDKKSKWFEAMQTPHLVMWWVPAGHHPSVDEAMDRLAHLTANGDSDLAFGWSHLPNVKLWMSKRCA